MSSSEKGKIVDQALQLLVKGNQITISKAFLVELTAKIKELSAQANIKGGLSLARLKKAIHKLQLRVHKVTNCGLEHMRSMAWKVKLNSFA